MNTAWWSLEWVRDPLWLILNALTAYRLTRLWVADMLPPLPRMRAAVARWAFARWEPARAEERESDWLAETQAALRVLPDGHPDAKLMHAWHLYEGTPPILKLFTCIWCSGYWISFAVFLAATALPAAAWTFVAVPLAFSAVVGLLHADAE